jgi:uncharacterized protein involved in exopolysaccharide biosynthesis
MVRYIETFFRHRRLLLVPVGLILIVTAGIIVIRPPAYQSTARLWVDRQTALPQTNATVDNPYLTPAQNETAALQELLSTQYFCVKVGRRGPLAQYLATHPSSSNLLSKLGAMFTSSSDARPATPSALNGSVYDVLSKGVLVFPTGPQVVEVTFTYGNPQVAAGTVQAVVDQFLDEVLATRRAQQDTGVNFYKQQVQQAQNDLATADGHVNAYLNQHPELRSTSAVPDTKLIQLQRDDDLARQRYEGLLDKLDQAQISAASVSAPGASGYRVLDAAQVPSGSTLSKTALVQALGLGLGLGLLVLVAGLVVLTVSDTTLRRPEDVEQALGLRLVGSVPRVWGRAA